MFVPGTRQRISAVPQSLGPFLLAAAGVFVALLLWGILTVRTVSNQPPPPVPLAALSEESASLIAYSLPNSQDSAACVSGTTCFETLYVRSPGSNEAHAIAQFPYVFDLRPRGTASPTGDRVAVLHLGLSNAGPAELTILDVASGHRLSVSHPVDYLSPLAWAPDGSRLAAVLSRAGEAGGRTSFTVLAIDPATGGASDAAAFADAVNVVPVGYSLDAERLYVVVVDKSGSSLWEVKENRATSLVKFSPGATRDWSLSPDGTRLAFVDRLGVGKRTYAGRTLHIATGKITDAAPSGDQLGTAWRPDRLTADFGGPDGSLRLEQPDSVTDYVLPMRWAPDGSMLAATIYSAGRDGTDKPTESIEILSEAQPNSPGHREPLAPVPGARFFGWVRDLN